jgi:plasmid maintenance system antidote protein VapI
MLDQQVNDQQVDDKGTDQERARQILTALRDRGFDADNAKLAIALGRSTEQVENLINGSETIDDDVVMKARGIALNRGIDVE